MALHSGDVVVYDSLMGSNISRPEKSLVRQMYERLSKAPLPVGGDSEWQGGVMNAIGKQGESLVAGGMLAAVNVFAEKGLDSGPLGTPVDGIIGVLFGAASTPSGTSYGRHVANIGASCMTVFGFRKMTELLAEKRLAAGSALPRHLNLGAGGAKVSGESPIDDDPIVRAARAL